MKTKIKPKPKEKKLLLNLLDGERHRHRVALVTEEGEWNQHEPNSGMARMFVVMLLVHVVLIMGIIVYDFMGDDEKPQQTVTQATRAAKAAGSGLPQAAPEIVSEQARAAANTDEYDNYEMRSGDSLKSIAAKFGTSEDEITRLNMIDKGLQIGPGTMLRVPRQAVPSAIPVDPKTLKPMVAKAPVVEPAKTSGAPSQPSPSKVPSEVVKPTEAPASLAAATITPISLLTPAEAPPEASSLDAAANTPATVKGPAGTPVAELPPPTRPKVTSLLNDAPPAEKPAPAMAEAQPAAPVAPKAEPKALPKPTPVAPPSQMLKKVSSAQEKAEAPRKAAEAPAKPAPKAARTHVLKSGETLYRLSTKYGVSVAAIQKANNIKNPNAMRDGMKLVIPAK